MQPTLDLGSRSDLDNGFKCECWCLLPSILSNEHRNPYFMQTLQVDWCKHGSGNHLEKRHSGWDCLLSPEGSPNRQRCLGLLWIHPCTHVPQPKPILLLSHESSLEVDCSPALPLHRQWQIRLHGYRLALAVLELHTHSWTHGFFSMMSELQALWHQVKLSS